MTPGAWAVLASGPSLSQEDVARVRRAREDNLLVGVAAVSNVGLDMAPWADCLVSHDSSWWSGYPEAFEFKGEKVCANSVIRGGIQFRPSKINGCNSGLMAMEYVWKQKEASRIIILGFDMQGTHYFGKHSRTKLRNTTPQRFSQHLMQFDNWRGPPVTNCTKRTALKKFPIVPLEECLIDLASQQG